MLHHYLIALEQNNLYKIQLHQAYQARPGTARNGEACRASPTCFWSSLINLISKDIDVVFLFILHYLQI